MLTTMRIYPKKSICEKAKQILKLSDEDMTKEEYKELNFRKKK